MIVIRVGVVLSGNLVNFFAKFMKWYSLSKAVWYIV